MNAPKKYTADGETLTMREWAERSGCSANALNERVKRRVAKGMSLEDAILTPPMALSEVQKLGAETTPWRRTNSFMVRAK